MKKSSHVLASNIISVTMAAAVTIVCVVHISIIAVRFMKSQKQGKAS